MPTMLSGLNNTFETEAIEGALPRNQVSPQKVPFNLYAEQINGSAFTAPRHQNVKAWQYRLRPSVSHQNDFTLLSHNGWQNTPLQAKPTPPTQMRWDPQPLPTEPTDFVDGMTTMVANEGGAIHLYAINQSMTSRFFYNADADMLIIPESGGLEIRTEYGIIEVEPKHIAVIQRGIRFQVRLKDNAARGYLCENFGAPFRVPDRGPIGANGLADERHFLHPTAWFEERSGDFSIVAKFNGQLWESSIAHSPLDVVAWQGNYAPYCYDLTLFNPVWSVHRDHSDPSIFTVLTSPSLTPGVANIDFVIFPARWMVVEESFRPPYYHRNIMSEYMGLVHGEYDAKEGGGFVPGGGSLHNCMSAHGPDKATYDKAINATLKPHLYDDTLAFMLESSKVWQTTNEALEGPLRQQDYLNCWQGLESNFQR